MEKDDDVNGATGTSYDYGARLLDPRVGRWLSMDPLAQEYSNLSPYQFAGNNPLFFIDEGGEKIVIHGGIFFKLKTLILLNKISNNSYSFRQTYHQLRKSDQVHDIYNSRRSSNDFRVRSKDEVASEAEKPAGSQILITFSPKFVGAMKANGLAQNQFLETNQSQMIADEFHTAGNIDMGTVLPRSNRVFGRNIPQEEANAVTFSNVVVEKMYRKDGPERTGTIAPRTEYTNGMGWKEPVYPTWMSEKDYLDSITHAADGSRAKWKEYKRAYKAQNKASRDEK